VCKSVKVDLYDLMFRSLFRNRQRRTYDLKIPVHPVAVLRKSKGGGTKLFSLNFSLMTIPHEN